MSVVSLERSYHDITTNTIYCHITLKKDSENRPHYYALMRFNVANIRLALTTELSIGRVDYAAYKNTLTIYVETIDKPVDFVVFDLKIHVTGYDTITREEEEEEED